MKFFQSELKLLGHIIDGDGIRMDPHKVDGIEKWKTPTNKDLLLWLYSPNVLERTVSGVGVKLNNVPGAETINLVTDACLTGASGVLTQGNDLKTGTRARVTCYS